MRKNQQGTTMVEFAIIAVTLFIVLFGVIEVGRAFFVWNTVSEATRRGARLAAVCPPNHTAVAEVTILNSPGGGANSPILQGLSTGNVSVEYLDEDGNSTGGAFPISYVRVSIVNYQHTLLIPFLLSTITVPPFSTTLPAESLGYIPELGARQCFGT
ncbi:MAG: TadE family protein [Pseudomonadota bacterium]